MEKKIWKSQVLQAIIWLNRRFRLWTKPNLRCHLYTLRVESTYTHKASPRCPRQRCCHARSCKWQGCECISFYKDPDLSIHFDGSTVKTFQKTIKKIFVQMCILVSLFFLSINRRLNCSKWTHKLFDQFSVFLLYWIFNNKVRFRIRILDNLWIWIGGKSFFYTCISKHVVCHTTGISCCGLLSAVAGYSSAVASYYQL